MNELMISYLGDHAPTLIDFAVKATLLLTAAGLLTLCLRKASAALRHLVWFVAVLGTVALPLMESKLPAWEVTWLPEWREDPAMVPTTVPAPTSSVVTRPLISEPFLNSPPAAESVAEAAAMLPANSPTGETELRGSWLFITWSIVALGCLTPFLIGYGRLHQITSRSTPLNQNKNVAYAMNQLELRRDVAVRVSGEIRMPLTWGCLRPVVLVPVDFDSWSPARQEMVLLHEFAHIKRNDWLTQLLASGVAALYWFHPLVWLAARRMRVEREQACDDLVLRAGSRPSDYADELLQIATTLGKGRWINPVAVPMARRSSLEGRLLCILDATRKRRALTRWVVAAALIGLISVVVPIAMLQAAAQPEQSGVETADKKEQSDVDRAIKAAIRTGYKDVKITRENDVYRLNLDDTVVTGRTLRMTTNNGVEGLLLEEEIKVSKDGVATISGERFTLDGTSKKFNVSGKVVTQVNSGTPVSSWFSANGMPVSKPDTRSFVRLVLEPEQMTFEGKTVTDDQLRTRLENIPVRKFTVFELAISTDELPLRRVNEFQFKYGAIAHELGFEYASFIGVQPAGSNGSKSQQRKNYVKSNSAATSPEETVNQWLALVRQMKPKDQWPEKEKKATWDALWDLTTRDSAAAPSVGTQRLWQLKTIRTSHQIGGKDVAMVVTHPYEDNSGRARVLYFLLNRVDDKWLIARADYGSPEDAQKRVEGFRMHPGMRYNVSRESLVGDWLLVFFSPTYLTHHANGSLEMSYQGTNGTTITNAGTWSVKGDVYTQVIDGKKTSGQISSLTHRSFRYQLPNGNGVGYERRQRSPKESLAVSQAEKANTARLELTKHRLEEITRLHELGLASSVDLAQAKFNYQVAKEPWNGSKAAEFGLKLKELQMQQAEAEQVAAVATAREKVKTTKLLIEAGRARPHDLAKAEYDLAVAEEPWNLTRQIEKQLELKEKELERARALRSAARIPQLQLDKVEADHKKLIAQFRNLISPDLSLIDQQTRQLANGNATETRRLIALFSNLKGSELWHTLASAGKDRPLDKLLEKLQAEQLKSAEMKRMYQSRHPSMIQQATKLELLEKQLGERCDAILRSMEITAKAQEAAAKVRAEPIKALR